MPVAHLKRGLTAGLLAGLAFGLFLALIGGPLVGAAEHAAGEHATHAAGPGSVAGGVLWGLLLGGGFGAAYYVLEPVLPGPPVVRSLVLAGAGFVVVSGAPWLAVPPQPAGIEPALSPDASRLWYAGTMVAGALACGLAGYLRRRLGRHGRSVALAGAALPLAALLLVPAVAPATPPSTLPPSLVATFRGVVVAGQVGLWLLLAGVHAWLLGRARGAGDGPSVGRASAD